MDIFLTPLPPPTQAYWVVLNATSCANDAQIEFLVERECVEVRVEAVAFQLSYTFHPRHASKQFGF